MDGRQNRHILGLDLVRFAAAAMVMAFHYDQAKGAVAGSWTGWVGVEIFFVISGFVISYSAASATPRAFAVSRFVRLMPSVWLCGTATALAFLLAGPPSDLTSRYVRGMVLWPVGPWIDGSYWSLPVEITFYALVWLAVCRLGWLSLERLLAALGLASAAYWGTRSLLLFFPSATLISLLRSVPDLIFGAMLNFGCYFALGGLLFLVLARGFTSLRLVLIALCIVAGAVQVVFGASMVAPPHAHKVLPVIIWLACTALIAFCAWKNDRVWQALGRRAPFVRLLGLATYPLYLLHDDIGTLAMDRLGLPMWLVVVGMICAALGIAASVEPPLQRFVKQLLTPRRAVPA